MQSSQLAKSKLSDKAISALLYLDRIGMILTTRSLLKKQGVRDDEVKELEEKGYIKVEEAANEVVIYSVNLERVRKFCKEVQV